MYLHRDAKVVYVSHPRTASVATGKSLGAVGFEPLGDLKPTHHTFLYDPSSPITVDTRHQWTVITTVRNHYDAIISWMCLWYRHTPHPRWTVRDFATRLDRGRWTCQPHLWQWHTDVDIVWRYETLAEDMADTLTWLSLDVPPLLTENVTAVRAGRPYQQFYTPTTRDYITERYAKDIDQWGYRYDQNECDRRGSSPGIGQGRDHHPAAKDHESDGANCRG